MTSNSNDDDKVSSSSSSSLESSTTPSRVRYRQQDGRTTREGKLLSLKSYSSREINEETGVEIVKLKQFVVGVEICSFLAYKHVLERNGRVIPSLPARLEGCDFQWQIEMRDDQSSAQQSVQQLVTATTNTTTTTSGRGNAGGGDEEGESDTSTSNTYWTLPQHMQSSSSGTTTTTNNGINSNSSWTIPSPQQQEDSVSLPSGGGEGTINDSFWTTIPAGATNKNNNNPQHGEWRRKRKLKRKLKRKNNKRTTNREREREMLTTFTLIDPNDIPPTQSPTTEQRPLRGTTFTLIDPNDYSDLAPTQAPTTLQQEQQPDSDDDWLFPFAITGTTRSSTALATSILASAYELPMMSGAATSVALERTDNTFARTIPTNAADAHAIMVYYHSIGVSHVANLFSQDAWGRNYNADLQREAAYFNISMKSFGYQIGNQPDMDLALQQFQQSGIRYVYAIIKFDWEYILEAAYHLGLAGNPHYVWISAEATQWTDDELAFVRHNTNYTENQRDTILASALNGVGSLSLHTLPHEPLNQAIQDFLEDPKLQQEYIALHPESHIFTNYSFLEEVNPQASFYHQLFYDATYAIGLAACQTPGLFTGSQLYETLVNLELEGVTGKIRFDNTTGTRSPDSVAFRIDNVWISDNRSDATHIRFESNLAAVVVNGQVEHSHRYQYWDNTTIPPPSLPPLEHDYHLIPLGVQIFGWICCGGFIMILSGLIIAWTIYYRNIFVVRVSQPTFLVQICLGTFIMASAIIPLGMSNGTVETAGLDAACMSSVWLIYMGFAIALSALFSKTWRMNQIMQSGIEMKRIEVRVVDAIWPFVLLMLSNITILVSWTITSPLEYKRIEGNDYDKYGRSLESHGECTSDNGNHWYFLLSLMIVDFIMIITATYQSYMARKLPTEFSESYYLAISMGCLTETLSLGGPIIFATSGYPTTFFVMLSIILCLTCLSILLPVFVPKYTHRNSKRQAVLRSTIARRHRSQAQSSAFSASFQQQQQEGGRVRGRMSVIRKSSKENPNSNQFSDSFAFGTNTNPTTGAFVVGGGGHDDASHNSTTHHSSSAVRFSALPGETTSASAYATAAAKTRRAVSRRTNTNDDSHFVVGGGTNDPSSSTGPTDHHESTDLGGMNLSSYGSSLSSIPEGSFSRRRTSDWSFEDEPKDSRDD